LKDGQKEFNNKLTKQDEDIQYMKGQQEIIINLLKDIKDK
jgi:hypothetical protein